jgi:hypothetical protein
MTAETTAQTTARLIDDNLDHSDISAARGGPLWTAQETLAGPCRLRLRYRVHHQPRDWAESYAIAEVWFPHDLAWHEIVTYQPSMWTAGTAGIDGGPVWRDNTYRGPEGPATEVQLSVGMVNAMTVLRQRAHDLVAVH